MKLSQIAFGKYFRQLFNMDIVALVARSREHYVEQLAAFADVQQRNCTRGSPEVKLQLGPESKFFERLCCVDFIKNDGKSEVIELQPERILSFEPILGTVGSSNTTIEHLRWDDMEIYHDGADIPPSELANWFQLWFDLNDERRNPEAQLSGVIHSLIVQPGVLNIDLGSAPADAFWDMLALLEQKGTTAIRVTSSRQRKKFSLTPTEIDTLYPIRYQITKSCALGEIRKVRASGPL